MDETLTPIFASQGWNDAQRQECLAETPETFDRAWDMLNIVAA
jgi:hypothetical protein